MQSTGDSNGMWYNLLSTFYKKFNYFNLYKRIIENLMYKKGGLVEKDSKFRLKHFVSGKYLSISI